ncbi:MAG: DNA primase [Bacteroidales bacterium]|nr:DNA primase [Bacteroidales bacterium]
MIPQEKISEILENSRIEEVVGEFVSLKKRGVNLIGLCPFHNEKTPSFTVSPSKGFYKCFGCGAAGNTVNFVMQHEKYTYPEALRFLADKYNIEIEEKEESEEDKKARDERESLFAVNSFAQKHFAKNLWETREGRSVGYSYFQERGFTDNIIQHFQLGYSPAEWDNFTKKALSSGYKKDYLEKTGLTIVKPNQSYDRFRNRVIFPIHNLAGRIVGFGGRILTNEKNKPKYLNSPESEIYNKRKVLYGLYFAKQTIVKEDRCHLVEGYTDVISLYQAGIKNVVASSGTSLTEDQILMIKRYTANVVMLYDGDPAGLKASFRGIDMFLEQGMNVKIVLFPEDQDPDSYARNHPSSETKAFIETQAEDFLTFKSKLLLKETENDPVAKANAIEEIAYSISMIPNMLQRDEYIKATWENLDIDQQKLSFRVNKLRSDRYRKKNKQQDVQPIEEEKPARDEENKVFIEQYPHEDELIRILLQYGTYLITVSNADDSYDISVAEFVINEVLIIGYKFKVSVNQEIFDIFHQKVLEEAIPDDTFFLNLQKQEISEKVVNLITEKYHLSENWEKQKGIFTDREQDHVKQTVNSLIWELKSRDLENRINELDKQIKDAGDDGVFDLLKQRHEMLMQYKRINENRGRIITKR